MVVSFYKKNPLLFIAIVVVLVGGIGIVALPFLSRGYPLASGDRVTSWTWKGPYQDAGPNEKAARTRIADLSAEVGKTGTSAYDLYIDIASQYDLLGDGGNAYRYLSKAIAADPSRGIAYLNMGHLMEELGALRTAKKAYDAAASAEAGNEFYQNARAGFLARHPGL